MSEQHNIPGVFLSSAEATRLHRAANALNELLERDPLFEETLAPIYLLDTLKDELLSIVQGDSFTYSGEDDHHDRRKHLEDEKAKLEAAIKALAE